MNAVTWPTHTYETRPWESTSRSGKREDRTLKEVTVSLPPKIAALNYQAPPAIARELDLAAQEIVKVDVSNPNHIEALSGLLLRMESVSSSKIEYIEANVDDFARAIAGMRSNASATSMVAASAAISEMIRRAGRSGRISVDDMLAAHQVLMTDDPYDGPFAGKLRTQQNWIGGSDYSPLGAIHIPPPPETVEEYISDLVDFANRDDVPALAQAAIVHAQFESIHPFTDGNGRIGRALINAVIRRRELTSNVVVPIASAFAAERERYFSLINNYRRGELDAFVLQLATGAKIAARQAAASARRIGELPERWAELTRPRAGSATAKILAELTAHPILTADGAHELVGSPLSSVYTAMDRLEQDGIIHEVTKRTRNKVWGVTAVLEELDRLSGAIAADVRGYDRHVGGRQ